MLQNAKQILMLRYLKTVQRNLSYYEFLIHHFISFPFVAAVMYLQAKSFMLIQLVLPDQWVQQRLPSVGQVLNILHC